MTRIVVTGANGFLGTEIVRQAAAEGMDVTAFVLPGTAVGRLEGWADRVVRGDVGRPDTVAQAMDGAAYCIHTAGNTSFFLADRERQRAVNVRGVRNVVKAARGAGVKRLVHTSSVAAVGYDPEGGIVDEDWEWNWPAGLPYMESKRDGEREALNAATKTFEVVSLNPVVILGSGPRNPNNDELVQAVRKGWFVAAPCGSMTVCDLEDVAAAHLSALRKGRSGQRYILGGPHVTQRELIARLARRFGVSPPRMTLPGPWTRLVFSMLHRVERAGWRPPAPAGPVLLGSLHIRHGSARAQAELGYRIRRLSEIVARTGDHA